MTQIQQQTIRPKMHALFACLFFISFIVMSASAANVNFVSHYNSRFKYSDFKGEVSRDVLTATENATLSFTLEQSSPFQFLIHEREANPEILPLLIINNKFEISGELETITTTIDDKTVEFIVGIKFVNNLQFPQGVSTLTIKPSNFYVVQRTLPLSAESPSVDIVMTLGTDDNTQQTILLKTPQITTDWEIPGPSDSYDAVIVLVMCVSLAGCVVFYILMKLIPFLYSHSKRQNEKKKAAAASPVTQRKGSLELSPQNMV